MFKKLHPPESANKPGQGLSRTLSPDSSKATETTSAKTTMC